MTLTVSYIGNHVPPHSTENDVTKALRACGADVRQLQENGDRTWLDLPALVEGSDLLLWTRTWEMDHPTQWAALDAVKEMKIPRVGFHLDRWWGLDRETQIRAEPYFTHTDLTVTADGGHEDEWRSVGVRHLWFPPAVLGTSVGLAQPDPIEWPNRIAFVGSFRRYHEEWPWRLTMVNALRKRYGKGNTFGLYPNGPVAVRGAALSSLYATVDVVVGDSCLAGGVGRYWSDRVPETLGRGGILLHPKVDGLAERYDVKRGYLWLYEAGDVDSLFRTLDEALEMSPEDRLSARLAGVDVVRGQDTYEHRMADLLAITCEDFVPTRRVWSFGKPGMFEPRPDSTDGVVIDETWRENVYRLDPAHVRGGVVVDLGANIGAVSIWAALHGARVVYAVEPEPGNLDRLESNLALNGLRTSVVVLPWAVVGAGTNSYVSMIGEGGEAKVSKIVRADAVDRVEARPFDHLMALVAPHGPIDFLKVDIEGGEWEILTSPGNMKLIGENVRRMAIEFHGPKMGCKEGTAKFSTAVGMLAEHGRVEVLGRPSVGGTIWWEAYR